MSLTEYSKTYVPKYHNFVEITKKHEELHWKDTEVKLQTDVEHWKRDTLAPHEKNLITQILKLFTQSDVNVGQNYYDVFIPFFKNNETRNMLGSFAGREGVHQRAYALLNDTLGLGEESYSAFLDYTEMAEKHEFMLEVSNATNRDVGVALAKQVLAEGVSLFASFVMLMNFDRLKKMPGMCDVVRWSIKDESVHVEGNAALFREFLKEHPRLVNDSFKAAIYQAARDMVDLEDKFIELVFEAGDIEGITPEEVQMYIRYTADYRLQQLGLKPNWDIKEDPLPWFDQLVNGVQHVNFFEREATYSSNNMVGSYDGGY